jgi:hypothetical protein
MMIKKQSSLANLLILMTLFLAMLAITQSPWLAEYWTRTISRTYQSLLGPVIQWVPISIMEIIFLWWLTLVLRQGWRLLHMLFTKSWHVWQSIFLQLTTLLLLMTNVYMATAGIAYQRLPVPLPQYQEPLPKTEYVPMIEHYLEDFNTVASELSFREDGSVINPHSLTTLNALMRDGFAQLEDRYFTPFTPRVKAMLSSLLYREFRISGIHFGPTTEALYNALIPDAIKPFTIAHEIAHAKGVMREDDANLVALFICLTSDDPYLRYSGYFATFYSLLNLARYIQDDQAYGRLVGMLNQSIRKDYQYQGTYWAQFDVLDRFAEWINDLYLKLLGTTGTDSYVDVPVIDTVEDNGEIIEVIVTLSPFQKLYAYWFKA